MRVAQLLGRTGMCSRRAAETLITDGRVKVNGTVLKVMHQNVQPGDRIHVDNKLVATPEPTRLWKYYKPRGLIVSNDDPAGRRSIFDELASITSLPKRVKSVGRLDFNSEGLLLLTNCGQLARYLELPANNWLRSYNVRVRGEVTRDDLSKCKRGLVVDGTAFGSIDARVLQVGHQSKNRTGTNTWLSMTLSEGKNREIRKVCESFGWQVSRLIRTSYGPFSLGDMSLRSVETVAESDINTLMQPQHKRATTTNRQPTSGLVNPQKVFSLGTVEPKMPVASTGVKQFDDLQRDLGCDQVRVTSMRQVRNMDGIQWSFKSYNKTQRDSTKTVQNRTRKR